MTTDTQSSQKPVSPILVFGSQGSDFISCFEPLLFLSNTIPVLQVFFQCCLQALRDEIKAIAANVNSNQPLVSSHQELHDTLELLTALPPLHVFQSMLDLVTHHRSTNLEDPLINGVLLAMFQLAHLVIVASPCIATRIKHTQNGGNDYTYLLQDAQLAFQSIHHPQAQLLGFCTGILSASALCHPLPLTTNDETQSEQRTIWQLIQSAIKVIRICFWISLRSKLACKRLDLQLQSPTENNRSWSRVLFGCKPEHVEHLIEHFNTKISPKVPEPSRIVATAYTSSQVSVGGPPNILEIFCQWVTSNDCPIKNVKVSKLFIYSPYHNPSLDSEVEQVMSDLQRTGVLTEMSKLPNLALTWQIWDTVSGTPFSAEQDRYTFTKRLVQTNLSRPARWDLLAKNLANLYILQNNNTTLESAPTKDKQLVILSFGPGVGLATQLQGQMSENLSQHGIQVNIIDVPQLLTAWAQALSTLEIPRPTWSLGPNSAEGDEIAIVSMACRFPGDVKSPEQLWNCLETGRDTVSEIPSHLFDINSYFGDGINQTRARHMHALPEKVTTTMDARLMNMSPKEIEQLDPQHRLTLLCAYEALEKAGYSHEATSPSSFDRKRIAICMGAAWDDYRENASHNIGSYFITGNIRAFIPGHVSFSLNWEGPSVSVDTLENSAVTAIDWARRMLLNGQCDIALAGAVNVITQPQMFIAMDKDQSLSRKGQNSTFCQAHDGTVRGDGCGILLLKRLSTAIKDGDGILATIPQTSQAFIGSNSSSLETVRVLSNRLKSALNESNVPISSLVHVEASGHHSLQKEVEEFQAFEQLVERMKKQAGASNGAKAAPPSWPRALTVSSTRPNLGAGEAVSAMAGVMKAILILQKGVVPRHKGISHMGDVHPEIARICKEGFLSIPLEARSFDASLLAETTTKSLLEEESREKRPAVLVNSISSSGGHGVVVVQKRPHVTFSKNLPVQNHRDVWVITLSAKTKESLEAQRREIRNYLYRDVELGNLSYTLTSRRIHWPFRNTFVVKDQDQLSRSLIGDLNVEPVQGDEIRDILLTFQGPPAYENGQDLWKSTFERMAIADPILTRIFEEKVGRISSILTGEGKESEIVQHYIKFQLWQLSLFERLTTCSVHPSSLAAKGKECLVVLAASGILSSEALPFLLETAILRPHSLSTALENNFSQSHSLTTSLKLGSRDYPHGEPIELDNELLIQEILGGRATEHLNGVSANPKSFHITVNYSVRLDTDERAPSHPKLSKGLSVTDPYHCFVETIAKLHQAGHRIAWDQFHQPFTDSLNVLHDLPTYPFQLQRYWMGYHDRNLLKAGNSNSEGELSDSEIESEGGESDEEDQYLSQPSWPLLERCTSVELDNTTHSLSKVCYQTGLNQPSLSSLIEQCFLLGSPSIPSSLWIEMAFEVVKDIAERCHLFDIPVDFSSSSETYELIDFMPLKSLPSVNPESSICIEAEILAKSSRPACLAITFFLGTESLCSCTIECSSGPAWPWEKLEPFLKSRIDQVVWDGEMIGSKMFYRLLDNVVTYKPESDYYSVQKVYYNRKTLEATSKLGHLPLRKLMEHNFAVLPALHESVWHAALWVCNAFIAKQDKVFSPKGIGKIRLSKKILLGQIDFIKTCGLQTYSSICIDKNNPEKAIANIYILNESTSEIIAEIESVELQLTLAKKPTPTPASRATGIKQDKVDLRAQPSTQMVQPEPPSTNGAVKNTLKSASGRAAQIHEQMITAIAAELGVAVTDIQPQAKFADLGLDSLMSLVCMATLETLDLGLHLPQSLFLDCSSSTDLLDWIKSQIGEESREEPEPEVALPKPQVVLSNEPVNRVEESINPVSSNSQVEKAFQTLYQTLESELGLEPGILKDDILLADLGLDSLMALLVLGSLSSEFNFTLPSSLFLDYPTLRDLRKFFEQQFGQKEEPSVACIPISNGAKHDSYEIPRMTPKMPTCLQQQPTKSNHGQPNRKPFFIIPDGSGMSTVYRELGSIQRPLYGLNSAFLSDPSEWKHGVGQIAQYYLDCIKLVQFEGPYLIGGWSFGGMVAFEIARILQESKKPSDCLEGLLLIDSPAPSLYPPLPMSILDWIMNTEEVRDIAPPSVSPKLQAHFQATLNNLATYKPQKLQVAPKNVFVFSAKKALPGNPNDIKARNATIDWLFAKNRDKSGPDGWDHLVPNINNHFIIVGINSNHFTMMRKPGVEELSDKIRKALNMIDPGVPN